MCLVWAQQYQWKSQYVILDLLNCHAYPVLQSFQVVPLPLHCKKHKGAQATFFCNLTVQKAYKSSLKNAHKSGYWMCEIGEKIKPQFKVDLIQFVNAATCCWNKKKSCSWRFFYGERSFKKTTYSRYHIQKLTKAYKNWNIYLIYQRPLINFLISSLWIMQKGFIDKFVVARMMTYWCKFKIQSFKHLIDN